MELESDDIPVKVENLELVLRKAFGINDANLHLPLDLEINFKLIKKN